MSNQFKVSNLWAQRLQEHHISLPAVLRRAGLPEGFFQQEKIYVTTAELFALWRAVGQTSSDPVIGLKLGSELRLERNDPAAIAAFCSRTFRDAVQRIAFHKQLTCPEEIRIRTVRDEASVEFAFIRAEGDEPDVLVDICLSWIVSIGRKGTDGKIRSEEHTSELQSQSNLVCRLLLEKNNSPVRRVQGVLYHYLTHLYGSILTRTHGCLSVACGSWTRATVATASALIYRACRRSLPPL